MQDRHDLGREDNVDVEGTRQKQSKARVLKPSMRVCSGVYMRCGEE